MKRILLVLVMIIMIMPGVFAEDVEVVIPDFDITINGNLIDNQTEPYPFIAYKGITYIPMTWDLSLALGLELKWDPSRGLKVSKRDMMKVYVQKEKVINNVGGKYSAEVVDFPVEVNGVKIDNSTAEYPLLNFRNITYFPMTYDYMVNQFSSGYKWDNDTGLKVSADENLEINIPKPYEVKLKVDHDILKEEIILSEQMIVVEYDAEDDYENIRIQNGMNHLYDGYYYNAYVAYYDNDDELIYRRLLFNGRVYESKEGQEVPYSMVHGLPADMMLNHAYYVIELELLPIPVARAKFHEEYKGVIFKYFDEVTLSYDDLALQGVAYIDSGLLDGSFHVLPDDLIQYAAGKSTEYYTVDGEENPVTVGYYSDGEIELESFTKSLIPINKVNKAYVDPRQLNFGLKLYKGDVLVDEIHKGYIKLYDKDFNLIRVLINKAEVDKDKGL